MSHYQASAELHMVIWHIISKNTNYRCFIVDTLVLFFLFQPFLLPHVLTEAVVPSRLEKGITWRSPAAQVEPNTLKVMTIIFPSGCGDTLLPPNNHIVSVTDRR